MISKANAQKLAWLWQDENKVAWIESFIKIADKEGKLVPFILTDEQKEAFKEACAPVYEEYEPIIGKDFIDCFRK